MLGSPAQSLELPVLASSCVRRTATQYPVDQGTRALRLRSQPSYCCPKQRVEGGVVRPREHEHVAAETELESVQAAPCVDPAAGEGRFRSGQADVVKIVVSVTDLSRPLHGRQMQ